jgi:ABC-type antimicrobial peptide transport system permease subunit
MVVRQGMTLAGLGVAIGLVAAVGLTRLMASLLFGVDPVDPPTFGVVAVTVAAVAALASWLPAHRASTLDPATTLRQE